MKLRWSVEGDTERRARRGPRREERIVQFWIRRHLDRAKADGWVLDTDPVISWDDESGDLFIRNRYVYVLKVWAVHS